MKFKPLETVDFLVVHCSASPDTMDIGVDEIREWHRTRGFFDVGYHFVVRRNGDVETGRPVNRPGAHAVGFNHRSLGICLVGGVDVNQKATNNFTEAQFRSLLALLDSLVYLHPRAQILGHRDLPRVAKACPSFDVRKWLEEALHDPRNQDLQSLFEWRQRESR